MNYKKKNNCKLILFTFLALNIVSIKSKAQSTKSYQLHHKYFDNLSKIGVGFGVASLPKSFSRDLNPSIGLNYSIKVNPTLDIRSDFILTNISSPIGLDSVFLSYLDYNNLIKYYKGNIIALQAMPQFNLISSYNYKNRNLLNFYVGAGLGYMNVNRKEIIGGQVLVLGRSEVKSNDSVHTIYIPLLIGTSLRLNDTSDLAIETSYFQTFNRKIDGMDFVRISEENDRIFNLNLILRIHLSIKKKLPVYL